jgi:hypothetical protein
MSTVADSDSALARRSIDGLLERYVSWREQCAAVRRAYRSWDYSGHDERALAYAGYVAALDREEHAARVYAEQVERVSQICT